MTSFSYRCFFLYSQDQRSRSPANKQEFKSIGYWVRIMKSNWIISYFVHKIHDQNFKHIRLVRIIRKRKWGSIRYMGSIKWQQLLQMKIFLAIQNPTGYVWGQCCPMQPTNWRRLNIVFLQTSLLQRKLRKQLRFPNIIYFTKIRYKKIINEWVQSEFHRGDFLWILEKHEDGIFTESAKLTFHPVFLKFEKT